MANTGARVVALQRSLAWAWNHPANTSDRVGGVRRVVRFWLGTRILGKEPVIVTHRGIRLAITPGMGAATKAIYGFPPDFHEMNLWARILGVEDLFIDVGANVGIYSVWAASHGARVVAFEPSTDSWESLLLNIRLNGWDVDARKQAVGADDGRIWLTRGSDAMNTCLRNPESEASSREDVEEVSLVRLDSLFDCRIRGLKVDVEGFEDQVLLGARQLLSHKRIDYIQFEWNGLSESDVPTLLREFGYVLFRPIDGALRRYPDQVPLGSDVFAASHEELIEALASERGRE